MTRHTLTHVHTYMRAVRHPTEVTRCCKKRPCVSGAERVKCEGLLTRVNEWGWLIQHLLVNLLSIMTLEWGERRRGG